MNSLVFIVIAAVLNSIMDILENENFSQSRLKGLDERFWYKRVSWIYAMEVFNYKVDGWHLTKSLMIIMLMMAIVSYVTVFGWFWDMAIYGVVWNVVFESSYRFLKQCG